MKNVISIFDFTGDAVRPWAEAGYTCYCFDIQHTERKIERVGKGKIVFLYWDADRTHAAKLIVQHVPKAVILFGFPPCDDLAGCGAKHWPAKRKRDFLFQEKAATRARLVERIANMLGCPFLAENPSGALPRLWRKWNYTFHPCYYGAWIPHGQWKHPKWPMFIAPRDAYKKLTCLWTGNGFVMPERREVKPEIIKGKKDGSRQFAKLGGKSLKTKNIRSSSPRGFFLAVYEANR